MNQPGTVALGFVGNGTDQRAIRTGNLFESLGNTVLSNNGNILLSLQLAHRLYRAQCAGIGGGRNQDSTILGVTSQKIKHQLTAFLAQPAGVHPDEKFSRNCRQARTNRLKSSGDTAAHQWARLVDVQSKSPANLAAPYELGVLSQAFARLEAHSIIVHAKESGVGVRYVHRNQRDTRGINLVGDYRGNMLIDLEFNH